MPASVEASVRYHCGQTGNAYSSFLSFFSSLLSPNARIDNLKCSLNCACNFCAVLMAPIVERNFMAVCGVPTFTLAKVL